jgi:dTDP-4-amino-4,6-dideoxygalactose transaminase
MLPRLMGPGRRRARIPLHKPFVVGKELAYVRQAVESGRLAGDGVFTKRCHELLERRSSAPRVLLTHSCTAALEISALLLDLQPGDEVVMPSFTFVSTANAYALRGATPVFADIRPDTLNLDERLLPAAIGPRTKAIVPVHYAGVACEMDAIMALARQHRLRVIEDAAHGLNATWRGRPLGTIGDLGAFSFHETKNCTSGEGGALVLNDRLLAERAEILREKGTNRARFFRGEIDKYTWVDVGSSYLPSELVAAFLLAQLEEIDRIDERRRAIHRRYVEQLKHLEARGDLRLPVIPRDCGHNAHLFYVLVASAARQQLARHLAERGIAAAHHYVPLHASPQGRKIGRVATTMSVTDDLSERLLRLPLYYELSESEQDEVIAGVKSFFGQA